MLPRTHPEILCPVCSSEFKSSYGLTQHINRLHPHSNIQPVQHATVQDEQPPCIGHVPLQCSREYHAILDGKAFSMCIQCDLTKCSHTNRSIWPWSSTQYFTKSSKLTGQKQLVSLCFTCWIWNSRVSFHSQSDATGTSGHTYAAVGCFNAPTQRPCTLCRPCWFAPCNWCDSTCRHFLEFCPGKIFWWHTWTQSTTLDGEKLWCLVLGPKCYCRGPTQKPQLWQPFWLCPISQVWAFRSVSVGKHDVRKLGMESCGISTIIDELTIFLTAGCTTGYTRRWSIFTWHNACAYYSRQWQCNRFRCNWSKRLLSSLSLNWQHPQQRLLCPPQLTCVACISSNTKKYVV